MSFQYPDKPWVDGQTVRRDMGDDTVLVGTYNLSKNLWSFARSTDDGSGPSGIVTTADVYTLNERPDTGTNPFNLTDEPDTVVNQQEANWWLFEDLDKRARKPIIQDTAPTIHPLYSTNEQFLIKGDMWVDISTDTLYWWDGSNWQEFSGGRPPIFSKVEPLIHPDFLPPNDTLISGDIWYDTTDPDEIISYIYDGTEWIKVGGEYVHRKGGDSMEGPLQVTGDRSPNADGIESTIEVLNVDSGQNSSLHLKHNGATQIYVGSTATSFQGDIKFNVGGRAIYAGNNKKAFTINDSGAFYEGNYSVDKHVATKKDVEEAIYDDILDTDTNKYVDRTGDSMSGPLVMDDTEVRFNNRSDGDTLIRAGRNEAEYPTLLDLRHPGGSVAGGYDIKIQGNTAYNQLRFVGSDTYLTMNAGGGAKDRVMFNVDISLENNRIENLGRAVNDTDAVPYGQVEEELAEFRDELVSNLTFGTWQYASGSNSPLTGRCYFRNALNQNSGISPNSITQMVFNEVDIRGAVGAFDRIDLGEIISLTDGTVTIKYRINSAASVSGSSGEIRSFQVVYISQTGPIVYVDGTLSGHLL